MGYFTAKRFLPLFITQFLGALNDNLLKNALVVLITYRLAADHPEQAQMLVTVAAGLFILPFFLLSAMAGQMADKFSREKMTRVIKLAEIALMLLAAAGFMMHHVTFLLIVLFGMGVHSTFFGPLKYVLLPQHLQENELLSGNAAIEAGTFLAILIGTILGGVLIVLPGGDMLVSVLLIVVAVVGYVSSRAIPSAPAPDADLHLSFNIIRETGNLLRYARNDKRIFRCIMGISWFWFVGATLLAQFPAFAKDMLHADASVVTLFLTVFSLGIGLGSFLCNKLLRGTVQSTFVPLAALGMTLFCGDLAFTSLRVMPLQQDVLLSLGQFLQQSIHLRIVADLFLLAVCGGIYIVPLYAILQHDSDAQYGARVIAANNVVNAAFMVGSALFALGMLAMSLSIAHIFLATAAASLLVAFYICNLLPDALLRSLARAILTTCYRVRVNGLENFTKAGDRVLLVANHTSFLDAAIIAAYLPEKITFAINTHMAEKWWIKPLLRLVDALPLDPLNPLATKALIEAVRSGKKCMIFPEGRLTVTGSLMKIYEGPGMIADRANAVILPIRIDGAQYSPFSRLKGKVRRRLFPVVHMTVLPPHDFHVPPEIMGRVRRQKASAALYDIMSDMMFESSPYRQTLFSSLIDASHIHGGNHIIAEDIERKPLNYASFIMRSITLGAALSRHVKKHENFGLLLPNAVGTAVTFFAAQAFARIPAMLNFTSGAAAMVSALETAGIKTLVTSKRFVELARLQPIIDHIQAQGFKILYLEDLRTQIILADKTLGVLARFFPSAVYKKTGDRNAATPAVILFTSGSEGVPKGVVLSHANIQANRLQLAARVDFGPDDKVFNCLPMFHAFGLTGGTLLPLLSGIKIFFYPSPLHYRIVPELVYDTNSTILFGTDTFLSGYARSAHPYDLHSVRYIFAGAEKLREETRRVYNDKFGVRVFEGYGATETAPVLATNTPMQNRAGTVGRFMPGIQYRLENVPGIDEGGQLFVHGPNIMLGYLRADKPGILQPLADGWYDTGDIVAVDEEGYVTIKGRIKRFAKIAGEMVSLGAVEDALAHLWPQNMHLVVSIPDERKGEQLVVLTNKMDAARDAINMFFKDNSLPDIALPRKIITLEKLPLLGTGKADYQTARTIALKEAANNTSEGDIT